MEGHGSFLTELLSNAGDAAKAGARFLGHAAEAAKERVEQTKSKAKSYVSKKLFAQPAGARIVACPKNKKAERVAERNGRLAASKERLKVMPPGKQREALAHATERFERNNVAVERARLAEDVYNVGQGEPPEGWERVTPAELRKLGMNQENFPQIDPKFDSKGYKDGYYADLYRAKTATFGQEQYVLSFRGTQGMKDGATDITQAFGGDTDHYSRAIKTAIKLKRALGNEPYVTGHSMGGGMAIAAGLIAGLKVDAIDPAGVHPLTLERVGGRYNREFAKKYVTNYIAEGEILDSIQNPGCQRAILAGITLVTPTGGVAIAIAGHRAVIAEGTVTFGTVGTVHKLPVLVNAQDVLDGSTQEGMFPGLGGRVSNTINPKQKIHLHEPKYVIAGIEQQKADDLHVMDRTL